MVLVNPKLFVKMGLPLFKKIVKLDDKVIFPENTIIKKKVGNYKFENPDRVYIYQKLFWSGFYNIKTFLSLRMLVKIKDNILIISNRVSTLALIRLFLIIVGFLILIIWGIVTHQNYYIPIVGFIFLLGISMSLVQSYFAFEDNYNSMLKELKEILIKPL